MLISFFQVDGRACVADKVLVGVRRAAGHAPEPPPALSQCVAERSSQRDESPELPGTLSGSATPENTTPRPAYCGT